MTNEEYMLVAEAVNTGQEVFYNGDKIKSVESSSLWFNTYIRETGKYTNIAWKDADFSLIKFPTTNEYSLTWDDIRDTPGIYQPNVDKTNLCLIAITPGRRPVYIDTHYVQDAALLVWETYKYRRVQITMRWTIE